MDIKRGLEYALPASYSSTQETFEIHAINTHVKFHPIPQAFRNVNTVLIAGFWSMSGKRQLIMLHSLCTALLIVLSLQSVISTNGP